MKRSILYLLPALCFFSRSGAQTPFPAAAFVDINNINARVMVHGDMFWDPNTEVASCEYPKGSGKHMNFASALWMSGYDAGNQLHVSAQTYRQNGNDYWPGPLTATDSISYGSSYYWAKIWKVNRADITSFQALTTHTTSNTPPAILTWPAKGNANAAGNGGAALTISGDLAPFVDLNGNGIYEPLLGEFPDIPGDQALWWVFNDHGPSHLESKGLPLGVEVHAMAYAYHRGTLIDDVIYFDYQIVNKSPNTYHNFRLALFDDIDLGYYLDDYIGFDSTRRMGITYNGTNDDGLLGGHPANSYGTSMPVVGTTMIVMPGDTGSYYTPVGSYITYNNDGSVIGNPANDTQYNYYIRGRARNGMSMYSFLPPTHNCRNHDSDHFYFYTGDPSVSTDCSECSLGNATGDRRFVISTNDFTITPGNTQHVVMAVVTTPLGPNNGCPSANFDSVKIVADTAWNIYHNPLPPLLGVNDVVVSGQVRMYPNPAYDKLFIESIENTSEAETIMLYNLIGQSVTVPMNKKGNVTEADISSLPGGLYLVEYKCGGSRTTAKFLKK